MAGTKLHKSQLASDRTSCRSPVANQVRLFLHTGANGLMLTVRDAIPAPRDLARAEFDTLRQPRPSGPSSCASYAASPANSHRAKLSVLSSCSIAGDDV